MRPILSALVGLALIACSGSPKNAKPPSGIIKVEPTVIQPDTGHVTIPPKPIPQPIVIPPPLVKSIQSLVACPRHPGGQYPSWVWSVAHDTAALRQLSALVPAAKAHVFHPVANVSIPNIYDSASAYWAAVNPITADADALTVLAYWYAVSGDTNAAHLAANALRGWAKTNVAIDSVRGASTASLFMAEIGGGMIQAAELLRPYMNSGDVYWVKHWGVNVLIPGTHVDITQHQNNWADWGVYLLAQVGWYADSESILTQADIKLEYNLQSQISVIDASMPAEIARGPGAEVWYTYFALDPALASAEILVRDNPVRAYFDTTMGTGKQFLAAQRHLLYLATAAPGLTEPRPQDPWPADLFTAAGYYVYGDPLMQAYAAKKQPNSYLGHHYVFPFASLTSKVARNSNSCT